MTRVSNAWAAYPVPAELQVICPRALDHNIRPFFRAWPIGVIADIADGLLDKRFIARRCGFAEFLLTPSQNLTNIVPSGGGKADPRRSPLISQVSARRLSRQRLAVQSDQ